MPKQNALILGGELRNRGAQAMTIQAVKAVRSQLPDLEPVLLSTIDAAPRFGTYLRGFRPAISPSELTFKVSFNGMELLPGLPSADQSLKRLAFQAAKKIFYASELAEFKDLLKNTSICLDVSGFAFSAQRGMARCHQFLDRIESLYYYGVPMYLLPQSFGPFDFGGDAEELRLKDRAREVLTIPRAIFARERQGYEDILELCPEARCYLGEDIVLQGSEIHPDDFLRDPPITQVFEGIAGSRNVGVVPNAKTFDAGDEIGILALWGEIVRSLLEMGYDVHVIRHSEDDLDRCIQVKQLFSNEDRVCLHLEERNCYQYGSLFTACDFLIASRFHSIVHAYRCGVPCVALGWATKYEELLDRFGQGRFVHDVRSLDDEAVRAVFASVCEMSEGHLSESEVISARLREIQSQENVFEKVVRDFTEIQGC